MKIFLLLPLLALVLTISFSSCEKETDIVPEEAYTVKGGLLKINAEKAEELKLVFQWRVGVQVIPNSYNYAKTCFQELIWIEGGAEFIEIPFENFQIESSLILIQKCTSGNYKTCLTDSTSEYEDIEKIEF